MKRILSLFLLATLSLASCNPSYAAVSKLSQIATGGTFNAATDKVVGVRSGVTDYQLQLNSVGNFAVKDYGALCDGARVFDGTVTSHANDFSTASYSFVNADIGKTITISPAVNQFSGVPIAIPVFTGTIIAVPAGHATLSGNQTGAALTGAAVAEWGTDDTAAIQATLVAAQTASQPATSDAVQGATVVLPKGICNTTAQINVYTGIRVTGQGMNASAIKWVSTSSMAQAGYYAALVGIAGNGNTKIYQNFGMDNFEIDMDAAQVNAGYSYHAKCIEMYNPNNLDIHDMYMHGSPATCIGIDFVSNGRITNNFIYNAGHLNTGTGGGGAGMAWQTGVSDFGINAGTEQILVANNTIVNSKTYGIENEASNATVTPNPQLIIGNTIASTLNNSVGIADVGGSGSVIVGNSIYYKGTSAQTVGAGIAIYNGVGGANIAPGIKGVIESNVIRGFFNGIDLENATVVTPDKYSIRGNTIIGAANFGIQVKVNATNTLDTINITDNYIDRSGSAGIAFVNSGSAGTINNATISGNTLSNNAATTATDINKSGILISDNINGLIEVGNYAFDNSPATQKYGQTISTGITVTNALMNDNHFNSNTTSGCNNVGTMSGWIANNYGVGCNNFGIAAVTPGSSPWTYTAGSTPEVLYLQGGTVSSVTKNSISLATALSATQALPINLNPGETVTVTYTVVPAANVDRK